jgi:uncharacterized membrane protein YgdD (TMEM256/DUF423 family)
MGAAMSDETPANDANTVRGLAPEAARWGALGAISALVAVAAGAFGAHALRGSLEPRLLATFETAARYQLIHGLALLAVAWALDRTPHRALGAAGASFALGTLLFSGSLYALALGARGAIAIATPFGGLAFMTGWLLLAIGLVRGGTRRV